MWHPFLASVSDWASRFWVGVWGLGFRVSGLGCRILVEDFGYAVQGLGFEGSGL